MEKTLKSLEGKDESEMISAEKLSQLQSECLPLKRLISGSGALGVDWTTFVETTSEVFHAMKGIETGMVANYIPQLAKVDPSYWAVSVCTVDGQQINLGDTNVDFCIQSCSKPITYCLALEERGETSVHQHVGREPSGRGFNAYKLNHSGLPFNPMVNSGAMATAALVAPKASMAERFDIVQNAWKRLGGNRKVGFDNATYQSEKKTADRNFALGFLLKESGVFPSGTSLEETLDLYFQCCSIAMDTETLGIVAATLANGGVCPLTGERIFSERTVKNTLSLMYSCGMYDFSGEWAFSVGIPAKSGVAGAIMVVVPGVMGACSWSPRLDKHGNSVRGIAFFRDFVERFDFHIFSIGVETKPKKVQEADIISVCYAAGKGDLDELKKLIARGVDVNAGDYDGRTPLHLACSEGNLEVVKYLVSKGAALNIRDRWGGSPLSDAERGKFTEIVQYLISLGATKPEFRGGENS